MNIACKLAPGLLLTSVLAVWPSGLLAQHTETPNASPGLLVLRNGNVLRGEVLRLANHYRVEMKHGGMQVPVEQVEMFCQSLDEAYEQRRKQRTGSTADSHLELARWCLKHDLLEYASRELLDARTIDPHHRRLGLLERQLQHALQRSTAPPPQTPEQRKPTEVRLVDATLVEETPSWARKLFVRKIQPSLVRSCATTGCHQSGGNERFQLNRLALDGVGHPEATLNNLSATITLVDFRDHQQSTLLEFAGREHGTKETGASGRLSGYQLQLLDAWVEQLVLAKRMRDGVSVVTADYQEASEKESGGPPEEAAATQSSESALTSQDYLPVDPFDAEAFNRRYAADRQKPARR